jgi:FkbM family methyltransferase
VTGPIKKFTARIKARGINNTLKIIMERLSFEGNCLMTSLRLNALKIFYKKELIIDHGKYKLNFYGGGDRNEILYHAFWDTMFSEEKDKIKNYIKQGDIVVDVGGNLGFFVLILDELVGKEGKIYTVEPSSLLREKLATTIRNNQIENTTILNFALGESEGKTIIHYNPKQSGLTSIVNEFDNDSVSEEITITTLDKFSGNFPGRVSFLKIDTEGYEPKVLKGAKSFIEKHRPTIYIELGGDYQNSSVEALNILKELNYSCEAENVDLSEVPAGINFIATPKC